MKKYMIFNVSMFLVLSISFSFASDIYNEQNKKIIKLKETMSLFDNSDKFHFIYPREIKADNDGNIFVRDRKQLIQFNKDGKYLNNLFKHGLGPGEVSSLSNFVLSKNEIILYDNNQRKLLVLNKKGELIREKKLNSSFNKLLFNFDDKFCFLLKPPVYFKKKYTVKKSEGELVIYDFNKNKTNTVYKFNADVFGATRGATVYSYISPFINCKNNDKSFYFCNTYEYKINLFNMRNNSVKVFLKKDFERVKV